MIGFTYMVAINPNDSGSVYFLLSLGSGTLASPISSGGLPEGTYFVTCANDDTGEFLIEDLLLKNRIKKEHLGRLKENLKHIPVVPPIRLPACRSCYSRLLPIYPMQNIFKTNNQAEFIITNPISQNTYIPLRLYPGIKGIARSTPLKRRKSFYPV